MDEQLRVRLETGLGDMAPNLLNGILAQDIQPIASEEELFGMAQETASVVRMSPRKKSVRKAWYGVVAGMAAVFALVFGVQVMQDGRIIEGQVIVDVNPSISLSVNKRGRVQKVEALNEDGVAIVNGLSTKKGNVDTVLESVFDSLEEQDYLRGEKEGVLVSYCYVQESADVEARIQTAIMNQSCSRQNCTFFSQRFAREEKEEELAKSEGVSVGKYYFVNRIREESLAREEVSYTQTMEEIVLLMDNGVQVSGVDVYAAGTEIPGTGTATAGTENTELTVDTTETGTEPNVTSSDDAQNSAQGTEADTQASDTEHSTQGGNASASSTTPGNQTPGNQAETPGNQTPEPGTETPEPQTPVVDVSKLQPAWLSAELGDDNKVYLVWDSPEGASGYDVYYRSAGMSGFEQIAGGVTGDTCVISGFTPGRSYEFAVLPYVVAGGQKYYGQMQVSQVIEIPTKEPEETGQPKDTEKPTDTDKPDKSDKTDKSDKPDKSDKSDRTDDTEQDSTEKATAENAGE